VSPSLICVAIALFLLSFLAANGQGPNGGSQENSHRQSTGDGTVHVPNRPQYPLFKGRQGKQKSEIRYDPATGAVTIRLVIQDASGYFIPDIRPENFAVYENNIPQKVDVNIEHAQVWLGLLCEFGGRSQALNKMMAGETSEAGRQILDALAPGDKIAVWKYADRVEKLVDFSQGKEAVDSVFLSLQPPTFSETNLYDALSYVTNQLHPINGRKAIILISSGLDTFSKTTFQEALASAGESDSPIYVIGTAPALRRVIEGSEHAGSLARINWNDAESKLQEIARASGGRAYFPESTIDLSATYDDMMENLRVRYVISYKSPNNVDLDTPRDVRVELINPSTRKPLRIVDARGKPIQAHVSIQGRYVPRKAAVNVAGSPATPVVAK
jgi:VWFA-related protein